MYKNRLLLLLNFLFINSAFAQVGINTKNPHGTFHVDGAKDNLNNSVPDNNQQLNDFIITSNGNVGSGTIEPSVKFELNNQTLNGAIKIVDGTQSVGKVLRSDANGVGTWQFPNSFKSVVLGVYPSPVATIISNGNVNAFGAVKYTNIYMDLTPGKWIVNAGLTVRSTESLGQRFWLHAYLSTSQTELQQNGFNHLGPAQNDTSYASLIFGNPTSTGNPYASNGTNFISGSSLISVNTNVRINLLIDNSNTLPITNGERVGSFNFKTDSYENYFYAIPVE